MQFFTIIVLLNISPVLLTNNEDSLYKYKAEIHRIGSDVEEFIFDVAKEVFKNADPFFNLDYEENIRSEKENPKKNNAINKNNAESYEEDPANNDIEDSRKKRSIVYNFDQEKLMPRDNFVGANIEKTVDEKILEEKHIKEIKEELVKLYELVAILKDQQTMLSLLDKKEKELSQESDPNTLLTVLEHINNNLNEEKEINKNLPTHKELEKLKFDLRKAISNLSQTKNVLKEEKEKESSLEKELIHQREQIDLLKSLLDKVISNNLNTNPTQNRIATVLQTEDKVSDFTINNGKEIVGAPIFIPKDLPQLKNNKKTKKDISEKPHDVKNSKIITTTDELKTVTNNNSNPVKTELNKSAATDDKKEVSITPNIEKKARTSEFSDETQKIRSSELETRLGELEKKMENQIKEDDIKKEMTLFRNLLEPEKPSSRTFSDEDVDLIKRLLKLTDSSNKPQGKSDDIEDELKKLENSINALKPSAEVKDLDLPSGKIQPQPNKGSTVTLSTDQIIELRKKLDQIIDMQAKKDIKNVLSIGGSSHHLDFSNGPFPYPMWYRPPFVPDGIPPPFDYPYYPNFFNPFYPPAPYEQEEYFNNGYDQNAYDYGSGYKSIPHQHNSSGVKKQFFQDKQIIPIDKHIEKFRINQEEDTRRLSQQPETNRLQNNHDLNAKINIDDLKLEINALEKRIANLKSQAINGKFEDKSIIDELEKEIQGLKDIVTHSSQDVKPVTEDNQQNDHQVQRRRKRSTETTNKVSLDEQTDVQLYDDLASKLREYLVEDTSTNARTAEYEDIRNKINKLKSQLGFNPMVREDLKKGPFESYYQPPKYEYNKVVPNNFKLPVLPPKKDDIFTTMIGKALDKLIAFIPKILGKLFGESLEGIVDKIEYDKYAYGYDKQYNSNYGVSNDYNKNLELSFYSMGAFGYIPLIILKLVKGLSTFVSILKKNSFFKNFLVPAFVLLIVSGAVIFLIWWFKDDETNNLRQIGFENHRTSSEEFNKFRNVHRGTDYYFNNLNNVPYPMSFYPNYYRNYPFSNSKEFDSRTVNDIAPGRYYRTYFEDGSKKH